MLHAGLFHLLINIFTQYARNPTPHTVRPKPGTSDLTSGNILFKTLHPKPHTLHPTPYTIHPTPLTVNPQP